MSLKTRITIVLMALGLLMAALALSDDVEACEPNWGGVTVER